MHSFYRFVGFRSLRERLAYQLSFKYGKKENNQRIMNDYRGFLALV